MIIVVKRILSDLSPGEKAVVYKLNANSDIRRRFLDIGLVENTKVECVGKSPMSNPKAYLIRGAVIAIRDEDCRDVFISEVDL